MTAAPSGCERQPDDVSSTEKPPSANVIKSPASVRAQRRAFDGAPPVIPHENFGMNCVSCHNVAGVQIPGVGFAPPMPHEKTLGLGAVSNCRQCHVFKETEETFVDNRFVGLQQDLRQGPRLNELAPPVIPHWIFMRENCSACHDGPAAREEIRTPHPERTHCRQCHATVTEKSVFTRS